MLDRGGVGGSVAREVLAGRVGATGDNNIVSNKRDEICLSCECGSLESDFKVEIHLVAGVLCVRLFFDM